MGNTIKSTEKAFNWRMYLPFTDWLFNYKRSNLTGDIIAGVIVAVMLVPQGMAYALLAGLPPQVGLYASILPLLIYGLLGTSRSLAVGPVAMVSLLVASGIAGLQPANLSETLAFAVTLAFLVGLIQLLMGVFKIGFLVNFLSHPVLSGFTSAAALVIIFSQLQHLLGFSIPRSEQFHEILYFAGVNISQTNVTTLGIGLVGIVILLFFKFVLGEQLKALKLDERVITPLTKVGPLVIVLVGVIVVSWLGLDQSANIAIVGTVPNGLPPITRPLFSFETIERLLPIALTISIVGYMESISVAKALASKKREKVDANQELIALGVANLGSSFTGGYPMAGGFSRSVVNFSAGANTGLASIITSALVAVTLLFLTPLFFYLPNAVLAAIIIVATVSLVDVKAFFHAWAYSKADAISLIVTFIAVLELGIENGILIGVVLSLVLYLWRTSRPHIAILGRVADTDIYLNVLRHETVTYPHILMMRVDESLYFPNAQYLETVVLEEIADRPDVTDFVLVCTAINFIDTSALAVMESLHYSLKANGVTFHLSAVKGPVMDRLRKIGFVNALGEAHFYRTTHEACEALR